MISCLIVDDDKFERDGLRYMIEERRLPLHVADVRNGKLALDLMNEERFDMVITDIKMPVMDGITFLEKAKELQPDAVYIIYSGYSDFHYAKKAISLRVMEFLVKPVSDEEFDKVMRHAVSQIQEQQSKAPRVSRSPLESTDISDDSAEQDGMIRDVKQYIRKNYANDLSVEAIAKSVYLSSAYLCTVFKKQTGTTLIRYLTSYRMEKAIQLLANPALKTSEIARLVGYNNISYFNLLFKEHTGKTPGQFRKEQDGKKSE